MVKSYLHHCLSKVLDRNKRRPHIRTQRTWGQDTDDDVARPIGTDIPSAQSWWLASTLSLVCTLFLVPHFAYNGRYHTTLSFAFQCSFEIPTLFSIWYFCILYVLPTNKDHGNKYAEAETETTQNSNVLPYLCGRSGDLVCQGVLFDKTSLVFNKV